MNVTITRVERLIYDDISHLVQESVDEGFRHLKRLIDEYQDETNRFDKQGEALFAAHFGHQMVGICGLNQTPYSPNGTTGRVRRLYVSKAFRRLGVGKLLMHEIVEEAKRHYGKIVLKTDSPAADQFYCSLGFKRDSESAHNTHYLNLAES